MINNAQQEITAAVLAWPEMSAHPHRFGGTEYRLANREIGHIHGDYLVDIPFPTKVRDELVAAGAAQAHHVLPESGWVSFYIRQPGDKAAAVALLRRSYELALRQHHARRGSHSQEAQHE